MGFADQKELGAQLVLLFCHRLRPSCFRIHISSKFRLSTKHKECYYLSGSSDSDPYSKNAAESGLLTDFKLALDSSFATLPVVGLCAIVLRHHFHKFTRQCRMLQTKRNKFGRRVLVWKLIMAAAASAIYCPPVKGCTTTDSTTDFYNLSNPIEILIYHIACAISNFGINNILHFSS